MNCDTTSILNPAAEFDYNPRVRELFADLQHAGALSIAGSAVGAAREPPVLEVQAPEGGSRAAPTQMATVVSAAAGSREQGACVQVFIAVRDAHVQTVRYQAYGCPHFLAACESLAQWLEGRACNELSQWRWGDVEMELQVPAAKRARLLLLENVVNELSERLVKCCLVMPAK